MNLDRFIIECICKPLGLKDSSFGPIAYARAAQPQVDPATGKRPPMRDPTIRSDWISGGSALLSTARDYVRFCQMLLNGGELGDTRLVSPTTIALMATVADRATIPPRRRSHPPRGPSCTRAADTGEVADERRAERSVPSHRLVQAGRHGVPRRARHGRRRVDSTEHLLRGRSLRVEVELDALTHADEPVPTARQADAIRLEAMPEARLHDAVAELDVADETMEVGKQIRVEVVDVGRDDGSEEDAAEPRRRISRQRAVTERDAARRRERTRVPDDQLGQNGQEPSLTRRDEAMTAAQSPAR